MLNETLVGQRRNVQEREAVLHRHEAVLARRQGLPVPGNGNGVNLSPALAKVEQLHSQLSSEADALRQQVEQLEEAIAAQEGVLKEQEADVQQQRETLVHQGQEVHEKKRRAAELWGKVNTYDVVLQGNQEMLNGLREKLNELGDLANQVQSSVNDQSQSVSELQNAVNEMTASVEPQLAAS